jgi:hypothetical protein
VDTRGVSEEQIAALGGFRRELRDVLIEVADGKAELIYTG